MKMFDATEVVPINFVFFTTSAIVAGKHQNVPLGKIKKGLHLHQTEGLLDPSEHQAKSSVTHNYMIQWSYVVHLSLLNRFFPVHVFISHCHCHWLLTLSSNNSKELFWSFF